MSAASGGRRRRLRRHVVIFGSCQGAALARLLRLSLPRWRYRLFHFWNNPGGIAGVRPAEEILEMLATADYAIYQPLSPERGELSADAIADAIADAPEVVTFPRILNDGFASLSRASEEAEEAILGQRYVFRLLEDGHSRRSVLERFRDGEIEFEQRSRFDLSLERLSQQEQSRGVMAPISDFIAAEHRRRRLFLTHNHPTTWLLAELCARIRELSGLPIDVESLRASGKENLAGLPERDVALTPYDVAALGYEFGPNRDWLAVGETLIGEIAAARGPAPA